MKIKFYNDDPELSMVQWLVQQDISCAESQVLYHKWMKKSNDEIAQTLGKTKQTIANQYNSLNQKMEYIKALDMGSCACCKHRKGCKTTLKAPPQVATVCVNYSITTRGEENGKVSER